MQQKYAWCITGYKRVNDESETCLVSVYRDLDLVTGHNLDVVVSLDYGDQITKSTWERAEGRPQSTGNTMGWWINWENRNAAFVKGLKRPWSGVECNEDIERRGVSIGLSLLWPRDSQEMCLKLSLRLSPCPVDTRHRAGSYYMTAAYFQTRRQVSYFSFTAYTKCFFWPHFAPATRNRRGEYWPYLARIENVKPQNVFFCCLFSQFQWEL